MMHFGTTRESKRLRQSQISTPLDKWRRHKNKERIWRRCVSKLELAKVSVSV